MRAAVLLLAAFSIAGLWQKMTGPTNSDAAAVRGVSAFDRKQPVEAEREFGAAAALRPMPQTWFNLGTSQVAAGHHEQGAATLEKAMRDPQLRPRALYNRGNAALASKAWENAVNDYTAALRLAPSDRDAKRNLEIALQRKKETQQQEQGGGKDRQQGASQNQQQAPRPSPQQSEKQQGETDAEALLRSVQQQEQEELQRMKRARGEGRRVGW
jgi:Ca-activated chloride channel family protein